MRWAPFAELSNHPHQRFLWNVSAKRVCDEREDVDRASERALALADQIGFVERIGCCSSAEDVEQPVLEVGGRVDEAADRGDARPKEDAVLSGSLVVRPDRQGAGEPLLLNGQQYVA